MEESEDEEEGRAELLGSKRRKGDDFNLKGKAKEKSSEAGKQGVVMGQVDASDELKENAVAAVEDEQQPPKDESDDDDVDLKPKKRVKKSKAKPTSYLDEILAERSKKKKTKGKSAEEA